MTYNFVACIYTCNIKLGEVEKIHSYKRIIINTDYSDNEDPCEEPNYDYTIIS